MAKTIIKVILLIITLLVFVFMEMYFERKNAFLAVAGYALVILIWCGLMYCVICFLDLK